MSADTTARFFGAIAGRYERSYAMGREESRQRMTAVLRALPEPPARVLDLGVGTGRELTALLDAGHAPTGVDISPAMLERCARRTRPVPLVLADFWRPLPFADASFDAVVALHGTLAHSPDDAAVALLARELARLVRGGGAWVSEVPSPAWIDAAASETAGGERSVRRTGPLTCVYEDRAAGVSVEARILPEDAWRSALGDRWTVRVDPIHEAEWLIVATRL